jgi:hypothetical protein
MSKEIAVRNLANSFGFSLHPVKSGGFRLYSPDWRMNAVGTPRHGAELEQVSLFLNELASIEPAATTRAKHLTLVKA